MPPLKAGLLVSLWTCRGSLRSIPPKVTPCPQSSSSSSPYVAQAPDEGQIERLQQVFEIIGKARRGKTCDAIEGIQAEGDEIVEVYKGTHALYADLLAAAQAVEHYEITRYGTQNRWTLVLA